MFWSETASSRCASVMGAGAAGGGGGNCWCVSSDDLVLAECSSGFGGKLSSPRGSVAPDGPCSSVIGVERSCLYFLPCELLSLGLLSSCIFQLRILLEHGDFTLRGRQRGCGTASTRLAEVMKLWSLSDQGTYRVHCGCLYQNIQDARSKWISANNSPSWPQFVEHM